MQGQLHAALLLRGQDEINAAALSRFKISQVLGWRQGTDSSIQGGCYIVNRAFALVDVGKRQRKFCPDRGICWDVGRCDLKTDGLVNWNGYFFRGIYGLSRILIDIFILERDADGRGNDLFTVDGTHVQALRDGRAGAKALEKECIGGGCDGQSDRKSVV